MLFDLSKLEQITKSSSHPKKPDINGIKSAATALLIGKNSGDSILGILKAKSLKYPWGNQVAFPGGIVDETDKSSLHAVLREIDEELGLKNVEITGSIGHYMTIRNVCIEVFAGFYDENEKITPLESEIARIVNIPFSNLFDTHVKKNFTGRQPELEELLYPVEDLTIWGVTARAIHHFLEISMPIFCKNPKTLEIY
ncbi:MAG: CoA pyrophosphatase [Desulforegulaceae bacterium]|jgi:8-oxo-dGTP pyrophosphatase MutT (NUDIX family)|nr:CoA pyrophosphatase [Desulforegulaceae bacterium]